MELSFEKLLKGYQSFREKYVLGDTSVMQHLHVHGQKPKVMFVACCDSRVDPALILQCDPGDLFVVRNIANIVPPYEKDEAHHGTSAALEFGICFLEVEHLIILGHSQCGGIQALLKPENVAKQNDFISNWVSIVQTPACNHADNQKPDDYAKIALQQSYENCKTFPWINQRVADNKLVIHQWFFDIATGKIYTRSNKNEEYLPL